tara:strand:+ start:267 stop:686 length:420 start_codon:yes stop_codon:yes gene_type:complete
MIDPTKCKIITVNDRLYQLHPNGFVMDHNGKKAGWTVKTTVKNKSGKTKTKSGYTQFANNQLLHRWIYATFTDWSKAGVPRKFPGGYKAWNVLSNKQRKDFVWDFMVIDHDDNNSQNNRLWNLVAMSLRENSTKGDKAA